MCVPPTLTQFSETIHALPSCFLAAVATWWGSNPNLLCNSFNGAEAPNVFMPMTSPVEPTYRSHPKVEPCSTATRAFTFGGNTLSRYSSVWCSKISHDGIDTTRQTR